MNFMNFSSLSVLIIGMYLLKLFIIVSSANYLIKKYSKDPVFDTSSHKETLTSMMDVLLVIYVVASVVSDIHFLQPSTYAQKCKNV